MSWWEGVLAGMLVSWPPAAVALWLGRRKLNSQTEEIQEITDLQTEQIRAHVGHRPVKGA